MQATPERHEPHQLSAVEAAQAIRHGRLTSEQLVRSCLDHIARRNSELHAWATIDEAIALESAKEMDRSPPRGPLHGVPVGVKDVIDPADYPTQFNSPIHAGRRPGRDAAVVVRARQAGMVVIGKTATQEFATRGDAGPTRHPLSPLHSPGGSSSGSAVAVASFMVPLAISTQTAGSIVRPASYCGVVGFKPSFNRVDTAGLRLIAPSFDTLGFHSRSVDDAALALEVFSDGANHDHTNAALARPLRISVCQSPVWHKASTIVRAAVSSSIERLTEAGLYFDDVDLPAPFGELEAAHDTISDYEARQALAHEWLHHRAGLSAGVQAKLMQGEAISDAAYHRAQALVETCRVGLSGIFVNRAALLTPSAPDVAPPFSRTETGDSAFSKGWTAVGLPCIGLPIPYHLGLPIGMQLVGAPGCDTFLMHVARQVEATFSFPNQVLRRHT